MNIPDDMENIGNSVSWLLVVAFAAIVMVIPFFVAWGVMAMHIVE